MTRSLTSILTIGLLAMAGCGYLASGEWSNDPANWKRAFGYSIPREIVMSHSWYWRGAHWSREEAYFFQFQWHEDLFKQLIDANKMKPVSPSGDEWHFSRNGDLTVAASVEKQLQYCFEKPNWFVPKGPKAYESWTTGDSDLWLFRDPITKELFLYGCQL